MKLKITLQKSKIGCLQKQIRTVEALGLHKIRSSVIHADSPTIRGMIFRVRHMVSVEEIKD